MFMNHGPSPSHHAAAAVPHENGKDQPKNGDADTCLDEPAPPQLKLSLIFLLRTTLKPKPQVLNPKPLPKRNLRG